MYLLFTPATFLVPVSHIHSMASADVVFVVPVPPADDRVTTVPTDGDSVMLLASSVMSDASS